MTNLTHHTEHGILRYEQADPGDRKLIEKLIRAVGKHVRDYFDMRNTDEYWSNGEVWVCWADQEPVAFAVIHPLKREPVQSLYQIGVHPEWRGLGIATRLMKWATLAHQDKPTIRLVVSEGNVGARRMYLLWGLTQKGTRETRRNGMVVEFEGVPSWTSRSWATE